MRIEAHDRLGNPVVIEATRAVIRTRNGDPFCICLEYSDEHYFAKHAGEEGFEWTLQALGVQNTLIVDRYVPPAPILPGVPDA